MHLSILPQSEFSKQQSAKAAAAYEKLINNYQPKPKDCPVYQKEQITDLMAGLAAKGEKF